MANVNLKSAHKRTFGNVPYGNVTSLLFALATTAAGAAVDSDHADPLEIGDVIDLGPLPEGLRLEDAQVIVTTGMTASVTGSLGFKYEDGSSGGDDAYFGSAMNLAAAGRVRAAGSKLTVLQKPARLTLTIAGADNAKASDISVLVYGEQLGNR